MDFYKLSELKGRNFSKSTNELYSLTDFNNNQYPEYLKWFYGTNIPRVLNNEGDALFSLDAYMLKGLIILKNTVSEKKICTLYVDEFYRKQKLGLHLLEESFKTLGTDKPIITIPKKNIEQFQYYIDRYNWRVTGAVDSYYSEEICFNN